MTLNELNKLKENLEPARKLKAKINKKKMLADSASPNMLGMPSSDVASKDALILSYMDDEIALTNLYNRIIAANHKAFNYIMNIRDEQTQLIFRYRFINGYSWVKVAMELGGGNTDDSVRKRVDRYLQKN